MENTQGSETQGSSGERKGIAGFIITKLWLVAQSLSSHELNQREGELRGSVMPEQYKNPPVHDDTI